MTQPNTSMTANDNVSDVRVSQRDEGFHGGIPFGLSATSKRSKRTEQLVRGLHTHPLIIKRATELGLAWKPGLSGADILAIQGKTLAMGDKTGGFSPDGGIFCRPDGVPVVSCEAKYQGERGNAIERLYKNHTTLKLLNPDVLNLVYCSGDGFFNNNSSQTIVTTNYILENVDWLPAEITIGSIWNNHQGNNMRLYRFSNFDKVTEALAVASVISAFNTYTSRI